MNETVHHIGWAVHKESIAAPAAATAGDRSHQTDAQTSGQLLLGQAAR